MSKATVLGKDFKALIGAVTKFPSIGGFAGSELVSLSAAKNVLQATSMGVILAHGKTPCIGDLPLIALDERLLGPFANLCGDESKVFIEVEEKELRFSCRGRRITAPFTQGIQHELPSGKGTITTIDGEMASKIDYLSALAFSDSSRAELCCVLVSKGKAMAVNQKCVALLKFADTTIEKAAIPLPLARAMSNGDKLIISSTTTLKNSIASYTMPSLKTAYDQFPVDAVLGYQKTPKTTVCIVKGAKLALAVKECKSCLGDIARTEVILVITFVDGKMRISSENGGARFETPVSLITETQSEAVLRIPLDEMSNASEFIEKEEAVTIAVGKESGNTFIKLASGFVMFASWSKK